MQQLICKHLAFILLLIVSLTKITKSQNVTCLNGGVSLTDPFPSIKQLCLCNKNFAGATCKDEVAKLTADQKNQYGCALKPCRSGATCEDLPSGGFTCHCLPGTFGTFCESSGVETNPCDKKPCYTDGTCNKVDSTTYTCTCKSPYSGLECKDNKVGPCSSSPCQNNAICVNNADNTDYSCKCRDFFLGKKCENTLLPCDKFSCGSNSVSCFNRRSLAFECQCATNYTGVLCNQMLGSSCDTLGCVNGDCMLNPLTGTKNCQCKSDGYLGSRCETELCNPTCVNGGVCSKDANSNYYCSCPFGYTGTSCEIRIPVASAQSCFSMNTMVETKERGIIKVSELNNKDFVKTFDYSNDEWKFSRFVTYLHKDDEMVGEYISVKTNSGRTLSISALHLIARRIKETSKVEFVLAKELKRSDYLVTEESREEQVAELELVYEKGAYAPLTESGTIAVNSIAASCYANTNSHSFIHLVFQPLIQWSKYFSVDSANFDSLFNTRDSSAQTQSLPDSVFWYAKFLFGLLPYVPYSSSFIIF